MIRKAAWVLVAFLVLTFIVKHPVEAGGAGRSLMDLGGRAGDSFSTFIVNVLPDPPPQQPPSVPAGAQE